MTYTEVGCQGSGSFLLNNDIIASMKRFVLQVMVGSAVVSSVCSYVVPSLIDRCSSAIKNVFKKWVYDAPAPKPEEVTQVFPSSWVVNPPYQN